MHFGSCSAEEVSSALILYCIVYASLDLIFYMQSNLVMFLEGFTDLCRLAE